jgi:hypothetical protein
MSAHEGDDRIPEALRARIRATRLRPQKKWPYVVAVAFVVLCGLSLVLLSNYHSHSPFCTVAWDAWTSLDSYRAHRRSRDATLDRLQHDVASMDFHLDAVARAGETKQFGLYRAVRDDVSAAEGMVAGNRSASYESFAVQDLPVALTDAGCRGFAPR